jgi:hypothetical protein
MNAQFIFSLEENAESINDIIKNLNACIKSEDESLRAMPAYLDGGRLSESHKEIIHHLKDAIYSLTNAEICIRYALE